MLVGSREETSKYIMSKTKIPAPTISGTGAEVRLRMSCAGDPVIDLRNLKVEHDSNGRC